MQGPEYYTQSFNATALGITVEDDDEGGIVVTNIINPALLSTISLGDKVVAINGASLPELGISGHQQLARALKQIPARPLKLGLRRSAESMRVHGAPTSGTKRRRDDGEAGANRRARVDTVDDEQDPSKK